jgi:hypothetical protein
VDKKIDMVLSTTDTDQIEVTPGQQDKNTSYTFTNEGNADQKFKFEVANLANDEEADYDTDKDNDDVNNMEIQCNYTDAGGNSQTAGWASDFIIEVKTGTTATCKVRADIKDANSGGDDGDIMNIELKATAYKDDESGPEAETNGTDTQGSVDIVFADGESVQNGATSGLGDTSNSKGDTAGDGIELARSGYIIKTPVLSAVKTSCVVSDPVNNTTDPKRIPGAVIRYMIDIKNTGSGAVTDLNVSDNIDVANLDYSTIATTGNVHTDAGDTACNCANQTNGTQSTVNNTGTTPEVKFEGIDVAAPAAPATENHTCVSFEVEIR